MGPSRYNRLTLQELESLRQEKIRELDLITKELKTEIGDLDNQILRERTAGCQACVMLFDGEADVSTVRVKGRRMVHRLSLTLGIAGSRHIPRHTCQEYQSKRK